MAQQLLYQQVMCYFYVGQVDTAGSTTITDGSNNNTTITKMVMQLYQDFFTFRCMKSVYFDGSGDYLQCTLADT